MMNNCGQPNISHNDPTPSTLCRVFGLTSEEGKKKNGSVGYVNLDKKFGSGNDARHPVCLDGFKGPMSIRASNLELFSEEEALNAMMVAIGRIAFFDARYCAIMRRGCQSLGQTPVSRSKTARSEGNLDAVEMMVKKHKSKGYGPGPVTFKLSDLNLARAFNRVARGEEVKLAAPLNKRFQRIKRMFPKDGEPKKVMVKYDPHRLWPDKFWTKLEKLGTQRYEAAKLGTYQIYPSSHRDNLDALELFYADGSGKRKDVIIQHELYIDYGSEEAIAYARHAVAMKETYRLYPEVLAGVDPHAFWSAILWIEPFMKTMKKLQLPSDLLDEWKQLEVGRQSSLDHFKASMRIARFDPVLLKRPDENWGITANPEQHVQVATEYTICAIEAVRQSLAGVEGISSVTVVTCGQFKGTEMWRYIRGTTMYREMKEKKEKESGQGMTVDRSIPLYRQCMETLGFDKDSKYWDPPPSSDHLRSGLITNNTSSTSMPSGTIREMKVEDLPDKLKDMTVIDWIVSTFLRSLMIPILGTDYDNPMMWNVLYKKGAKERIHSHMIKSFNAYLLSHSRYHTDEAMKKLIELKWSLGATALDQDPIFPQMQEELYRYLKEEEQHYDSDE
ncbi:hypothetical protein ACHAWF_011355 [Thalassiosira exigua]